ncbi:MAG: phage holin family protein [Pseudomonas sp.]|nr:phage holin family protein [Pseudomonas sp.]
MPDFSQLAPLLTAMGCFLGALRLAYYGRGRSKYRRGVSLLASLLGAELCFTGFEIVVYGQPVSVGQALITLLLCALIFRAKGNVAALLRLRR